MEGAWNPSQFEAKDGIKDKIKRCQEQLQKWNWKEFGNVNKVLKKKKKKKKKEGLQQLEMWDSLHGKAKEI